MITARELCGMPAQVVASWIAASAGVYKPVADTVDAPLDDLAFA